MRTRQKLTAAGAIALATTAIGGGAVVTSHAMADSPVSAKGTMTVVSMTDRTEPIKCVYDNVDLPAPPAGAGQPQFNTDTPGEAGGVLNVITGSAQGGDGAGPATATRVAVSSAVAVSAGSAGGAPSVVVSSHGDAVPPLPLPAGAKVIDLSDAREGTADECAALQSTAPLPAATTAP